ncbi:MAG TPA: PKD domain-containing protein, partial [Acidimicrobiales bacterium]|nr:PKD domain-containing protein [Acidimicrobiales bacterium]
MAISPDGKTAYAANASNTVTPISLRTATPTPGTPITVGTPTFGIAVAPDPPPVARLTVTPARAGRPSTLNASASTSADGGITKYRWNFGDGTSEVTTTPVVHHVYTRSGTYHPSVTETSRLGTSTSVTFTGQTVSNSGGARATAAGLLRVSGALQTIPSSGPPAIRVDLRDSTLTATCTTVDVLFDGRWVGQTTRVGHLVNDGSVVIPGNATLGVHHLQLSCKTSRPYLVSSSFTVVNTRNHLSEFSVAMPSPTTLGKHLLGAGGISLGMLLITRLISAGFPSEWLDSTYESNRHRIHARLSKRFPRFFVHHERSTSRWVRGTKGTAIFLGFIFAAGGINAVLDPSFGWNRTTLFLFLGQALGVGIVTMASQLPVAILGAREHRRVHLKVLLGGLVIAVICVGISRAVGLSPGYCYGLIAVFVLNPRTPEEDWGRIHAIASLVLFVVAASAFMLTVPVFHAATSPSPNPIWVILTPALNVTFLGGFASLAFSMFPLPFLPGRHVARWRRSAWLTISTVGMVGFI